MQVINRIPDSFQVICEGDSPGDCRLRYENKENELTVFLQAGESKPKTVNLWWENPVTSPVKVLGDDWTTAFGNLAWNSLDGGKWMPWYFLMREEQGAQEKASLTGYGVKVRPSAMAMWACDTEGVRLSLDVRCGGVGVELAGREVELCTVVSRHYEPLSAFEAACDFCSVMCTDPILPEKPVYGGNNWYYAYGKSSYGEIVSDCVLQAKLAEGLENRPFMVIDDGWQMNFCAGPWVPNAAYGDMKRVAEEFRRMNVRPGIWVRLLRDESPRVSPEWRINRLGLPPEEFQFMTQSLDPSHPEVLQFVTGEVKKLVGWGYELIKHDFSTYDMFHHWGIGRNGFLAEDGWSFYDKSKTSAEIVKQFYETVLQATEGKAMIMGCNCMGHLLAGYAHLNRIGGDTSGKDWSVTRKMGINCLAFRLCQHNRFFAVDADCVGIIPGKIDWRLNAQWAKLLAYSGTPLFVSCAQGSVNEEQEKQLKELYQIASKEQKGLVPLDWLSTCTPRRYSLNGEEMIFSWREEKL